MSVTGQKQGHAVRVTQRSNPIRKKGGEDIPEEEPRRSEKTKRWNVREDHGSTRGHLSHRKADQRPQVDMAAMFSDLERSPPWSSQPSPTIPPLTPILAASQHPNGHEIHHQASYPSNARHPVQPGWFPLQDTMGHELSQLPLTSRDPNVYSQSMLPSASHRAPMAWSSEQPSTYVPDTSRGGMYPSQSQGYITPIQEVNPGYGWHDDHVRVPPPPINTAVASGHVSAMHSHPSYVGMPRYPGIMSTLTSPRKKHQKEISIGRWTADEHRVFLKGLEMYQGPAWGEIARMIGTRTSTQVRTHAQKFFTKLARMNQTLPYFENQIQKERIRLISQGAVLSTQSSVTPTSTNAHLYTFSTLSPPQKRSNLSPRQAIKRDSHDGYNALHGYASGDYSARMSTGESNVYSSRPTPSMYGNDSSSVELYKSGYDDGSDASYRKHRLSVDTSLYSGSSVISDEHVSTPYSQTPIGYSPVDASTPSYRNSLSYDTPASQPAMDWSGASPRPWPQVHVSSVDTAIHPSHPSPSSVFGLQSADPDSLPSVTKLLYRSA